MPTIIVKNTRSKILGLTGKQAAQLATHLAVSVPNYYFAPSFKAGAWDGKEYFLSRPANTFPTGLCPKVISFIKEAYELPVFLQDERVNPLTIDPITNFTAKELRDYQIETINKVGSNVLSGKYTITPTVNENTIRKPIKIEDEELKDFINYRFNMDTLSEEPVPVGAKLEIPFPCGVINIATNGGKTVIAEGIIQQLYSQLTGERVLLFLTHSKEIANQARKSIMRDLNIPVGFIGNSKWEVEKVTVALIPTLFSRMKNETIEWDNLRKNTVAFIADECHHTSSDSWYKILQTFKYAYVRLGLTGTIDKSNKLNEMRLYSCTGGVLSKISNDYLIKHGYSAKPICILLRVNQPELGDIEWADAYEDGIVANDYRNDVIKEICRKEAGNTTLILVQHLEHGELLMEKLESLGLRTYFTHGQRSMEERDDLLEKLKNKGLDILISSNILDEGVDVSGIQVLIYARGRKSLRQLLQGIGRGLRVKSDGSNLRFYDFIDDTHTILLEHSAERCKALNKEKFTIKMFSIEQYLNTDISSL